MMGKLISLIMHDGSRHFGDIPEVVDWYELRDHLAHMPGSIITGFVTDDITEAWIDFLYRGYQFSANNQYGYWWFFVDVPDCPDDILLSVLEYAEKLV